MTITVNNLPDGTPHEPAQPVSSSTPTRKKADEVRDGAAPDGAHKAPRPTFAERAKRWAKSMADEQGLDQRTAPDVKKNTHDER